MQLDAATGRRCGHNTRMASAIPLAPLLPLQDASYYLYLPLFIFWAGKPMSRTRLKYPSIIIFCGDHLGLRGILENAYHHHLTKQGMEVMVVACILSPQYLIYWELYISSEMGFLIEHA